MDGIIKIQGIECYAYHGCLDEESKIGQCYSVDILLELNISQAIISDSLDNTVDYLEVYNIVKNEMAIRSKLIEHAAGRILQSLIARFPMVLFVAVTVHKFMPPVNGFLDQASVTISEKLG